jgi:hypothetical protein
MDPSWIFMVAIWAFFELVCFLIKMNFAKRMKIGAIGSTLIVSGVMFDGMSNPGANPVFLFITTFFMFGATAAIIYFFRLKAAKFANTRLESKKSTRTFTLIFKLTSQFLAIIIGFALSMILVVVIFGSLYLSAK